MLTRPRQHISRIAAILAILATLSCNAHDSFAYQDDAGGAGGNSVANTAPGAGRGVAGGGYDTEITEPEVRTTVFNLEFARASEVVELMQRLYKWNEGDTTLVADPRTNMILYRGPDNEAFGQIEQILRILDTPGPAMDKKEEEPAADSESAGGGSPDKSKNRAAYYYQYYGGTNPPANAQPRWSYGSSTPAPRMSKAERQQDIEQKSNGYARSERNAGMFAGQYHEQVAADASPEDVEVARQEVVVSVNEAFDKRQELQKAQIAHFEARIAELRRAIETRERLRVQIVERRIHELLTLEQSEGSPPGNDSGGGIPAAGSKLESQSNAWHGETEVQLASIIHPKDGDRQAWIRNSRTGDLTVLKVGSEIELSGKPVEVIVINQDHIEVKREGRIQRWMLGRVPSLRPDIEERMSYDNLDPDQVKQTVDKLLGPGSVVLEVLPEDNLFLVKGAEQNVQKVTELLELLQQPPRPSADRRMPAPPLSVSDGVPTGWIKSPEEYFEALTDARQQVTRWKRQLIQKKQDSNTNLRSEETIQQELATLERRLELIEAGYKAQMRLLEIDLEHAHSQWHAAKRAIDSLTKLVEAGQAPTAQLRALESDMLKADADLERAKAMYDVYQRAGRPLFAPEDTDAETAQSTVDEPDTKADEARDDSQATGEGGR